MKTLRRKCKMICLCQKSIDFNCVRLSKCSFHCSHKTSYTKDSYTRYIFLTSLDFTHLTDCFWYVARSAAQNYWMLRLLSFNSVNFNQRNYFAKLIMANFNGCVVYSYWTQNTLCRSPFLFSCARGACGRKTGASARKKIDCRGRGGRSWDCWWFLRAWRHALRRWGPWHCFAIDGNIVIIFIWNLTCWFQN